MASLRCHGDSDCDKTQIIRNFHLYMIQLRKPFFHIFTHGDVINAQISEVFPLKNPVKPPYLILFSLSYLFLAVFHRKRDEEVKKPTRSGSPNDIRNKENISKNDQKSPLYLLKLLSHLSILTMKITREVLFAEGGYS